MESLPLKEILASVVKEFESAGVAADVSREHWRQIYESNELLKEFSPSRLRISEASISLPLAFSQISKPKVTTPSLTSRQLLRLLPSEIPMELRSAIAFEAANQVSKTRRMTFANKNLTRTVVGLIAKHIADNKLSETVPENALAELSTNLERMRAEFMNKTVANPEREAMFAYQTEELLKMESDRIARIDIKLVID